MTASCCEDVVRPNFPPEDVALRVMKASDLPHVRALHRTLLPVSYPAAFFLQLLVNPRQLCLVATDHGTFVGFASATMGPSQPSSEGGRVLRDERAEWGCSEPRPGLVRSHITLLTLGVLPAYQRRGIGRALVHSVVQQLEASRSTAARSWPTSFENVSDQESNNTVLVQVQVAQSNSAGKCFYSRLGMIDQRGCDDVRLCLGPGPRTSTMAGVLRV